MIGIALASASTASDLRGLLGVSFRITPVMISGGIVVGGSAVLALNRWLAIKSVERARGYFARGVSQEVVARSVDRGSLFADSPMGSSMPSR